MSYVSYNRFEDFNLNARPGEKLIQHLYRTKENALDLLKNKRIRIGFRNDLLSDIVKIIAISHDFGKSSKFFQGKLSNKSLSGVDNPLSKHSLISAFWGLFLTRNYFGFQKDNRRLNRTQIKKIELFTFWVIRKHHSNLGSLEEESKISLLQMKECWEILKRGIKNYSDTEVKRMYDLLLTAIFPQSFDHFNKFEKFLSEVKNRVDSSNIDYNLMYDLGLDLDNFDYQDFFNFEFLYSLLLEADKKDSIFLGEGKRESEFFKKVIPYSIINEYKQKFDYSDNFNQIREKIYSEVLKNLGKEIENNLPNKIFSIQSPTGSGKTLMMLGSAFKIKEYFRKKGVNSRIIYILPFLSIIDQNAKVIREVLKEKFPTLSNDLFLENHHLANSVYRDYDSANNDDTLNLEQSTFLVENWYSQIIITTFEQFFYSSYTNKNRLLKRYNKFANSIILIDEVQAIPPKLFWPIDILLKHLTEELGCIVIIGTATKPLLSSYDDPREVKIKIKELVPSKYKKDSQYFNRYIVDSEMINENTSIDIDGLVQNVSQDFGKISALMTVFNTIGSAKNFYEEIKDIAVKKQYKIIFLSSNLPPIVRMKRISEIKKSRGNVLIITTQLIEAGVDISVDKIYRDFAPLDSLIQTAGRTNRNNKKGKGKIVIVSLKNSNNKSFFKFIYDKFLLNTTEEIIKHNKTYQENQLRSLLDTYYQKIIQAIGVEPELMDSIKSLNFSGVTEDFKLINIKYQLSFFVELDKKSKKLWNNFCYLRSKEFSKKFKSKRDEVFDRKKNFYKIKGDFLKYVVNVSFVNFEISGRKIEDKIEGYLEKVSGIYLINKNNKDFYNLTTGLRIKEFLKEDKENVII